MLEGTLDARRAHAALFERILGRMHRYFRVAVRNTAEADDCLQQTMLLIEESLRRGKYDPERSFNTWMWLKARTVFAQWARTRETQRGLADRLRAEGGDVADVDTARRVAAQRLLDRLQVELGDETHETFVLYYEGGLTQQEVGEVMGRDRKTVRKRINASHELLRRLHADIGGASQPS